MTAAPARERVYATNRLAFHEYTILETLEVGIVLTGTEIKSIRAHRVNLRDAYARIDHGELWLYNVHIAPYDQGNRYNHEPRRTRKLLAHIRQIAKLKRQATESGVTLVALKVYDHRGHVKVELAVARGKRSFDKRDALSERDARREIERAMKHDLQ